MSFIKDYVGKNLYKDVTEIADTPIDWNKFMNKTVLITGANGFIAYYLTLALLLQNDRKNLGITVMGLVRNQAKAEAKYGKILERSDLKLVSKDVCGDLSDLEHADYIIHAASQATPYYFENDPVGTIEANTLCTSNILQYACREKALGVLMISSLKVYGEVKNGKPEIEEEDLGYINIDDYYNCYATGKRTMETVCNCYVKQYGLPVKLARPSYIYGASTLQDDRVWAQFLANVIRKEDILLKSNGGAYRSFCYVTDTASALLTILLNGESGVPYNISSKNSDVTIRNFAKAATEVFPGRKLKLSFANKEDEAEPVLDYSEKTPEILSSKRLQSLGWIGRIDIKEGIRRAVLTMEERES